MLGRSITSDILNVYICIYLWQRRGENFAPQKKPHFYVKDQEKVHSIFFFFITFFDINLLLHQLVQLLLLLLQPKALFSGAFSSL